MCYLYETHSVLVKKGWRTSLDIWTNKRSRKNADSGELLILLVRSEVFAPLFPLFFIYFQTIVFLHRLLRLSQLVSLWSHRKIHYVSLNHQSASGEEPFLVWSTLQRLKELHQRCWKTVISLAVTLERHSPRHSAAPHHMSGSAVGSAGLELWGCPKGSCMRRGGGVGSAAGSLTSS